VIAPSCPLSVRLRSAGLLLVTSGYLSNPILLVDITSSNHIKSTHVEVSMMNADEKSVTLLSPPTLKFERWMDFFAEDLTQRERAARKRWVKQMKKLLTRCIVKKCASPLLDKKGKLRATNRIVKSVCRSCREEHKKWYRWFAGRYSRTYFFHGASLLKRRVGFDGVERFTFCRKDDPCPRDGAPQGTIRFTRGEMLDGSPVPTGVRGPDLVVEFDRPEVKEPVPLITGWERGEVVHKGRSGKHKAKRIRPWVKKMAKEK